jgi:hypothetical protein
MSAPTIRLSPRQYDLLSMDSYCEYSEANNPAPELAGLRAQLARGKTIHVSPVVLRSLIELADRDGDTAEQHIYRRLLAKAEAGIRKATEE